MASPHLKPARSLADIEAGQSDLSTYNKRAAVCSSADRMDIRRRKALYLTSTGAISRTALYRRASEGCRIPNDGADPR